MEEFKTTFFHQGGIEDVSECHNGNFIVTKVFVDENQRQHRRRFVMDSVGVIKPQGFKYLAFGGRNILNIDEKRDDNCLIGTDDGDYQHLVDPDGISVIDGIDKASSFAKNGFTTVELNGRNYWIDINSNIRGEEFEDVGEFCNGLGWAKLKGLQYPYRFIDENFHIVGKRYKEIITTKLKNYLLVKSDDYFVLNRDFQVVGRFDFLPILTDFGLVIKINKFLPKQDGDVELFNLRGKKISDCSWVYLQDEDAPMLRFKRNGRIFYLDQENMKILGGKEGFVNGEDFNGDMAAVTTHYDENEESWHAFLHRNGKVGKTYYFTQMIGKNIGRVISLTGEGRKTFDVVGTDEQKISPKINVKMAKTISSFYDGMAVYSPKPDEYSAVDKDFKSLKGTYEKLDRFSSGFAKTKIDGQLDFITKKEQRLSNLSKLALEIWKNPDKFFALDEEMLENEYILRGFYNAAVKGLKGQEFYLGDKTERYNFKKKFDALQSKFDEYLMLVKARGKHYC